MRADFTSRKGLRFPNGIPRVETKRGQVKGCVNEMSDNPADTDIAAATTAHNSSLYDRIICALLRLRCDLEEPCEECRILASQDADAVIKALNLRTDQVGTLTRYVTEWIDNG